MKSKNSAYIPSVDHLRFLAATLVLFQHSHARIGGRLEYGPGGSLLGTSATTPFDALFREGHTGVALFMVLSGFIFTHIAYGRRIRYVPFFVNRILRIYPLMLFVFFLGFVVHFSQASFGNFIYETIAVLAVPFQSQFPKYLWHVPELYPFTTLFWTIAPEFQFYILFPLILLLVGRSMFWGLCLLLLTTATFRVFIVLGGAVDPHDLSYWTIIGRIDQFLIGMIAASIYNRWPEHLPSYLVGVAVVLMLGLLFGYNRGGSLFAVEDWKALWPTVEGAGWGAFILGYLRSASRMPDMISRPLAAIGEVSFSMYLLHLPVIAVIMRLGPFTFGVEPTAASLLNGLLLVLPLTIVVSFVTFRLIERPFLTMRVRYLH